MSLLSRRHAGSAGADAAGNLSSLVGQASPKTVLKGLRIDGQVSAHEDMYIDTEINGPITSDASIIIGPSGIVHGEVKGRQVLIFGRIIGHVEATEKVALHDGGEISGDIYTLYISLNERASFQGRVDCSALDELARPMPPASETRSTLRESQSA